jgi:hypothetical protein
MNTTIIMILGLLGLLTRMTTAAVFDAVFILPEHAPEAAGPWSAAPLSPGSVTTDGRLLLRVEGDHAFWRLKVSPASGLGFSLGLPLINVPPATVKIARDFLLSRTAEEGSSFKADEQWRNAKLGDTVIPVYDAAVDEGRTPAYLEFKIVPDEPAPTEGSFRTTAGALRTDLGFILVSLTDNDFPVADWATQGETSVEQLRRKAGTEQIKPMRFGSGFMTAEDSGGGVRATEGTTLVQPSPDLLTISNYVGTSSGDALTGESNRTDIRVENPLQPYGSYDEMKRDYRTNEFFQILRARQKSAARIEWMIENGTPPSELRVQVGDPTKFFEGHNVSSARLETPDDDVVIARTTVMGTGGLQVDGVAAGSGILYVEMDGREELFTLLVSGPGTSSPKGSAPAAAAATFVPGWRTYKVYNAGEHSDQRWYYQYQSLVFGGGGKGNYVGCGPCAWTILMGWWDKSVPVVFRPYYYGSGIPNFQLGKADAPEQNDYAVEAMMHDFRDNWIDPLYCDIVSGQCGTPPDKMANGIDYFKSLAFYYNFPYLPLLQEDVLGYGYSIKWSYFPQNGVNDFNKLARDSVHAGYPSIIGIGGLSHYAVAYGYIEARYELAPGYYPYWRAWFKANWGNGGTKYYKFTDNYFFATKCHFWQTTTSYNP